MTFLESTNPVVTVSGADPIVSTGRSTPVISIKEATTSQKGAVQLEDSYISTSTIKAATPKSVKDVYDYTLTLSGTLQDSIDGMPSTLLELSDTPTTYSGLVGSYLRTTASGIDFFEQFNIDRVVYVAKNGSDDTGSGSVSTPFLTIQAGIDYIYTTYGPITDLLNKAVVMVAPGKYTEQIHSYVGIAITGYASGVDPLSIVPTVTLYNTGADSAHYPLRSDEDEAYEMVGINISTDASGVLGKIPNGRFINCRFFYGDFIERNSNCLTMFSRCNFVEGDHGGFYFVGTNLTGFRNILLRNNCYIRNYVTPTFTSTHTSFANFVCGDGDLVGNFNIGGDWDPKLIRCNIHGYAQRNNLDTPGYITIIDSIIVNGLHFVSNPTSFILLNSSFVGSSSSKIPEGEADITSDVIISGANIKGTVVNNGFAGEIKIINTTKFVGENLHDSYISLTEAVKASFSGDVVSVGTSTFEENIVLPEGVHIKGENYNISILTSISGVTLTLVGDGKDGDSTVSDMTVSSTASGIPNSRAIMIEGGEHAFKNCILSSTTTETYGETVLVNGGKFECRSSQLNYTNTISGGGLHSLITLSDGGVCLHDSHLYVDVADTSDDVSVVSDMTTCAVGISRNHINIETVSSGITSFIKQDINGNKNDILYNYISLSGTQGIGACYVLADNMGELNSAGNDIKVVGFDSNYLGNIGTNTVLKSHFDVISADDGVIGEGTYSFANSPDPGDIRISGSYINMYDNDIVVAKRGGEFTSIKEALESITDNSSTNRYNIHVHSGFYTEDNPIELKPYVYISGAFKHNPRIIPANSLEHLFVVPTGYCTCDFGEITLQAPVGDSDHQVYMVYAGAGCKPIIGFYNCLFLGTEYGNGDYCNGFYDEEILSGYHTVNCMLYGEFNKFAYMNGGSWTDSGTLPEFTTTLNHYLYMTGEGTALIDLMRNTGISFANLIYVNHADAKAVLSDVYSLDQKTLVTGSLGGNVQLRGSSLNGKIELDAGSVTIHSGTFENNSYIEALTGNLEFLSITSTRNKNENTYCVKVIGGGNTEIYFGGGNIFDSPNGIQSIQLSGSFSNVQVEGVRQYNIASLLNGESVTLNHLPDLDYSRIIQIQAFPSTPGTADVDYITLDEDKYIQEDYTKTDFINGKVTLSGIGLIAYTHWHMNETTGKDVYDSSGFNRDGLGNKVDNADWIAGKLNNCLKFDDDDEYVSFGNIASWDRTDAFSMDCWFYTTTDTQMYVLSKMENVTGKGYGFYLNARKPYFVLGNNATTNKIEVYSNEAVSSGAWHHGIFTYDGSSTASGINIYIDGDNKSLTIVSDALSSTIINTADFQMSGREGQNFIFNYGRIDEVVLYEKEASLIEADYRYNSGLGIEDIVCTHNTDKGWYVTTTSGSSLDSSTWTNIAQIVFTEIIPQYTQINYLLSTDGGTVWKYWDDSVWSSATLSGIDTYGNSSSTLEGLNISNWSDLFTTSSGVFDIAASLKTTYSGTAPSLDKVEIVYSIPGPRLKIGDSDIVVEYTDEITTKITNNSGGKLTGIKCNILKIQPY